MVSDKTDGEATESTCEDPCCIGLRKLLACCTAYAEGRTDDYVAGLLAMDGESLRHGVIEILSLVSMTALYTGCPVTEFALILTRSINEGAERARLLEKVAPTQARRSDAGPN